MQTRQSEQVSLVFSLLADLVIARDQHPLTRYEAPLHVPIGATWEAWVNGSKDERRIVGAPSGSMAADCKVPGFHAAVFYRGWLRGLISPRAGTLVGSPETEDELVVALSAAIERQGAPGNGRSP